MLSTWWFHHPSNISCTVEARKLDHDPPPAPKPRKNGRDTTYVRIHILESRGTKSRASVRKKPPGFCGGGKERQGRDVKKCAVFERCRNDSNGRKTCLRLLPLTLPSANLEILVMCRPAKLAKSCRHIKQNPCF